MDALSAILEVIKLEYIVCNKHEVKGSWALDIVQQGMAQFWRIINGRCMVGLHSGESVVLEEGDMVFVPHGASHWIGDSEQTRRISVEEYLRAEHLISVPDGETVLVSGYFRFEELQMHPFIKALPPMIHISRFGSKHHQLLEHVSHTMHTELNNEKPGSKIMLRNLAEMLFITVIRAYLEQKVPENSFLAALTDTQISKALKLMHDEPERDWTLESLAKSVAMSRSVFAGRFKKLVGDTPLGYLTNWRINKAMSLLTTEKINVSEVAYNVGYQSEAAFNRIFKSKTGKTPAMYRKSNAIH
jgi:AraC-like DNA-binding protein